jgi:hypothetical protein
MKLKATIGLILFFNFTNVAAARPGLGTCWTSEDHSCRYFIGKRLWVSIPSGNPNVVEVTFTQHDWTTQRTLKLKSGASFIVKDLTKASVGADEYYVLLDDGRYGWVDSASPFLIDFDAAYLERRAREECARRGQPKIGMTATELTASCWGNPRRTIKKTTAAGIEEDYVYSIGHIVKIIDGKVSEIIETR